MTPSSVKAIFDRDDRRTPASLEVPSWDGSSHSFTQYRCDIQNMKHAMAKSDYPSIVGRLIPKLTGPAKTAVNKTQVRIGLYDALDGYLKSLAWIQQAAGVNEHGKGNKHFEYYLRSIKRRRGQESMKEWQQKEAMAMLRLQEALQKSIEAQTGSDTDSGAELLPTDAAKK